MLHWGSKQNLPIAMLTTKFTAKSDSFLKSKDNRMIPGEQRYHAASHSKRAPVIADKTWKRSIHDGKAIVSHFIIIFLDRTLLKQEV